MTLVGVFAGRGVGEMRYLQMSLAAVEFVLAFVVLARLRKKMSLRGVVFGAVVLGAGILLPRAYPIGKATDLSIALQVVAVIVLLVLCRPLRAGRTRG
jgi:hypothetical protein